MSVGLLFHDDLNRVGRPPSGGPSATRVLSDFLIVRLIVTFIVRLIVRGGSTVTARACTSAAGELRDRLVRAPMLIRGAPDCREEAS